MKTTNDQSAMIAKLEKGTQKALALKQFNGENYFIFNDKAYEGDLQEETEKYESALFKRIHAFEDYVNENCIEIEPIEGDEERDNYIVLTDKEADQKAKESILDSLWAFTPSFLTERTALDPEVFEAIQSNGKCEGNNDTILNLIRKLDNEDNFVSAAISADGRGHFLNTYDDNENEETIGGTTYYIYRMN